MEALFPLLIVVIAVVGSIVSAASKERTQKENQRQMKAFQAAQNQPQAPKPQNQTGRTMSQPSAAAVPLQPTVHAHTTPECPTHDNYGSLDYASTEGKDPCHEAQLSHDGTPGEEPEAQPSLALEWTGENLVKAVVMQEILTRPCQRRAR